MKTTRIFHVRAPLQVRSRIDKKDCSPVFVMDRMNRTGGCTVLVTGDPDKPGLVEVQVAFCSKKDSYSRKLGIKTAKEKETYAVHIWDLPRELRDIEHQMLSQYSHYLKEHPSERKELTRPDWSFAMQFFTPKPVEAV